MRKRPRHIQMVKNVHKKILSMIREMKITPVRITFCTSVPKG